MTDVDIPQAAIEAVARQVFFAKRGVHWDFVWADEEKRAKAQQDAIDFAHAGLLAALPHLLAEVKVLTETATKVAYALGRKDAGEEIAEALEALADAIGDGEQREFLIDFADTARDIASQAFQAASDATSGVPGHREVSEAVRSPQEPCDDLECWWCRPARVDTP